VNALESANIEYATCGGLAMAIHGFARATLDIDVLLLSEDLARAWRVANGLGYDVEGLPLHFNDGTIEIRRISKIDEETQTLFTIDFLLVTEPLRDVWADRQLVEWEGGHAWVVSRDGLIRLKTISGRDIDLVDIRRLREAGNEN